MKIVVLAAGSSSERDVSIRSGYRITNALRSKGHHAIILDLYFGTKDKEAFRRQGVYDVEYEVKKMREMTKDVAAEKAKRASQIGDNVIELCKEADIVFLGLHGQNGEDGRIQAMFDLMGIKYTGSGYFGSALAMDKGLTKEMFNLYGVSTPEGFTLKRNEAVKGEPTSYPCVVKPCCGGSSVGISIVQDAREYEAALNEAFTYEEEIVVESYVKGRELSAGVLGNEALPLIEIIPKAGDWYDYSNKYNGETVEICPAELDEDIMKDIQKEAVRVAKILRLGAYSRVDFLLNDNGEFFCLEANTLPGMTDMSLLPQEAAAVGMDYPALCERLIELSFEKYK